MTTDQYRQWATENGVTHGSMLYVDSADIADAESYVSDYPVDTHDFETSGRIAVPYTTHEETIASLRATLRGAGYTQDGPNWYREGHRATASYHDEYRTANIFVHPNQGRVACATGSGGYLHSDDRPTVD
jgi:hypothetical protein